MHNDIFLADIIGYDWLKFSWIYTSKMKSWLGHWSYSDLMLAFSFLKWHISNSFEELTALFVLIPFQSCDLDWAR